MSVLRNSGRAERTANKSSTFFPAQGGEPDQYVGNMRNEAYTQAFAVLTGMIPAVGTGVTWRRFYEHGATTTAAVDESAIDSTDYRWNADGHATSALNDNTFTLTFGVEDHAGIFGANGENNVGGTGCDGTITWTVSDTTPPVISGATTTKKTLQECQHDHTVAGAFTSKTAKHTKNGLTSLAARADHASGAFDKSHYGAAQSDDALHMYYHDQVRCTDQCAGLVWTANPWSDTNNNQGRVLAASFPDFKNTIDLCKAESKYGYFCTNGARASTASDNTFQDAVRERTVDYFCRDYAGNEQTDTGHKIHVVDTTPPKIALSHACHDVGVHDSDESSVSSFSDRYHASDTASPHTRGNEGDVDKDYRTARLGNQTTDKHYRAHNANLDFDWATGTPDCINWNDDIGEEAGHEMYVSAGYSKELPFLEKLLLKPTTSTDFTLATTHINGGWSCRDSCDSYANLNTAVHWDGSAFPAACVAQQAGVSDGNAATYAELKDCFLIPGTYTVKYTCTDKSLNEAPEQKRTIFIEDHKIPIITVLGSQEMSLEATNEGNYVDDGATCSDQVDGMISQNVEVSGAVVNLTREGTYVITYSCADSAGYEALRHTRTVHVTDCNCPSCYMTGDNVITREASFPYVDETGWCTDDLDSTNPSVVHSQQATVDQAVNVEKTGVYYVTYFAVDTAGNWNYQAQTDCSGREGSRCDGYANDIRTVHIVDTLKPVIALNYNTNYFQYGDATDTGILGTEGSTDTSAGDVNNPVDKDHSHRVDYMAESAGTSPSGWMVGAIASAVTGLALLGYSRNTVATTVPV